MNHERLLMPHPVLRPGGFDYGEGDSFSMTMPRPRRSDKDIVVEASFNLSCRTLDDLIKNGMAKFSVLAKCAATYYRRLASSDAPKITFRIRSDDLWQILTLTPYVIASKDVPWTATDGDADLDNVKGDPMPRGSILAVGETHAIQLRKTGTLQSSIRITPNPKIAEGVYLVNSQGDFVVVEMGPKTFSDVHGMRQRAGDLLYPSVYQAALEFAMREMEEHEQSMWARALKQTLDKHGIDTDDLAERAHEHAQTLLNKPLAKMIAWTGREDAALE